MNSSTRADPWPTEGSPIVLPQRGHHLATIPVNPFELSLPIEQVRPLRLPHDAVLGTATPHFQQETDGCDRYQWGWVARGAGAAGR